jgi:hypothetical protein
MIDDIAKTGAGKTQILIQTLENYEVDESNIIDPKGDDLESLENYEFDESQIIGPEKDDDLDPFNQDTE